MEKIDGKTLDQKFRHNVAAHPGGENLQLCFACGTCTACCPVSEIEPEFNPRKIIRQIILGMKNEVLKSPVIWRCMQCYSCTAKCPQNVKFREIIRALREMAIAEGLADSSLIEGMAEANRIMLKLRGEMVNDLVSGRAKPDDLKKKAEEICRLMKAAK